MACLAGCGRNDFPVDAIQSAIDKKDREIQAALNIVTNWQSHFDLCYVKRSHFTTKLAHEIAYGTDNERYKKYMEQFVI